MPDDTPTIEAAPTVLTSRKASPEDPYRPGELQTVDFVEGLLSDAAQARRDQCDPDAWPDWLDTYWGDTWPDSLPSYKPRIVVNEIKSLCLQELSDLTDARLNLYIEKDRGSSDQRDQNAENSVRSYWTRYFGDMTVLNACLDAMIYPLGFLQTGWDPFKEQGQGQIDFMHRDPRTVYPDGRAETDATLRYYLTHDVEDLVWIRRAFPETGWLVAPEGEYSEKIDDKTRTAPRSGSAYTGPLYTTTSPAGVPGYKVARASVITCVVDDDETEEQIREVQGRFVQIDVPKYPHKRLILVANRRVLYDEDCPYHYAPTLTRVMLQPAVHSYWPRQSIVSEFLEIQQAANKSDSLVVENMLRVNIGEIFADADSGLTPKTYGGVPGMVYLIKPGSRVQKQMGQALPGEFVNNGERLRGNIRTTLGYPLSRTGAGTHGNVAAELAETEISQAMGLTRLRGRLLHAAVQKAVEMLFARMAQFYTTPRHLPYIEGGEWKSVRWEPIAKPETYAVHVDPSSFAVRTKTMMMKLFMTLAQMGKMPTKRLLKGLEVPDAEAIAQELERELQLMALAHVKQSRGKGKRA